MKKNKSMDGKNPRMDDFSAKERYNTLLQIHQKSKINVIQQGKTVDSMIRRTYGKDPDRKL